MGRSACEQGSWSENSLVWKCDTDLEEKEFNLPSYLLASQEMSQQDKTTLGLLWPCIHHSAPSLCAPVALGELARNEGVPAPTAHCLPSVALLSQRTMQLNAEAL